MKTIMAMVRVAVCALARDPDVRRAVQRWFWRLFGVGDAEIRALALPKNWMTETTTLPSAESILAMCRRLGLKTREGFYRLEPEDVAAVWNGMGPDAWPAGLREWISQKLEAVLPCSMPHDDWYENGNDGTRETWERTQREWHENAELCLADAARTCGWWRRIVNRYRSELAEQVLEMGGYACWRAAYERVRL